MNSSNNCTKNKLSKMYTENKENEMENCVVKKTTGRVPKKLFSEEVSYKEKKFLHKSNSLTRYPLKDVNQQDKSRKSTQLLNKRPSILNKNLQKGFTNDDAVKTVKNVTHSEETAKCNVTTERENHGFTSINKSDFSFLLNAEVDVNDNSKSENNFMFENENLSSPLHTPFNKCKLSNKIKNIKEIRKHASKINLSDKLKLDIIHIYPKTQYYLSNDETLYLTEDFLNSSKEKNKDKNETRRKRIFHYMNAYSLPGVVYLDPKENHVSYYTLYSVEYLDFIFEHQLKKEYEYHLSDSFLKKYTITNSNRSIVVNWMIKLQTYLKNEHGLIYTAIRIMDKIIDSTDMPLNMLQLVALASYWIALKFHAVEHKDVSWMVKQSCGAYTNKELILMEQEVFKANNFNINVIDFSVYVHYYILKLQLSNADIISQCAHYILDSAILDSKFVRVLPSMLVAASIYTSLILMNQYTEETWKNLSKYKGFYDSAELKHLNIQLLNIIKCVNNPIFPCREPYYKYSSSRYCNVTHIIADALLHN